ncbi:MAG: hemin uptake protein HemP [Pseudomonadota bacterium]
MTVASEATSRTEAEAQITPRRSSQPLYDARRLVDASGQASIVLDGRIYNLRITKQGKLLLTK